MWTVAAWALSVRNLGHLEQVEWIPADSEKFILLFFSDVCSSQGSQELCLNIISRVLFLEMGAQLSGVNE